MKVLILLFTFGGNGFSSVETQYVPSMKACEVVGKVFTDKLKTDWKSGSFECVVLPDDKHS